MIRPNERGTGPLDVQPRLDMEHDGLECFDVPSVDVVGQSDAQAANSQAEEWPAIATLMETHDSRRKEKGLHRCKPFASGRAAGFNAVSTHGQRILDQFPARRAIFERRPDIATDFLVEKKRFSIITAAINVFNHMTLISGAVVTTSVHHIASSNEALVTGKRCGEAGRASSKRRSVVSCPPHPPSSSEV